MLTRELPYRGAPTPARLLAAALLKAAGSGLARLAHRLAVTRAPVAKVEPVYEFYAEAGAPEGALYVDGQLVGHLPGVSRL